MTDSCHIQGDIMNCVDAQVSHHIEQLNLCNWNRRKTHGI